MNFFKSVLATVVGLFLFGFLSFILIIVIGVAAAAAGSGGGGNKNIVEVKDNSVIELDLTKVTNDYAGNFTYTDFAMLNSEPKEGLTDVLNAIDAAKKDDRIKGITITNGTTGLGMAQSKALRDKLDDFKTSKKFIVAYSDTYTQGTYYLNSVADTLYLNPVGDFEFKGLSSEVMFYKDLQEKTGITMEVIRHGKYKSAVEPFLANEMSPANREQITQLLTSVWGSVVTDISKSRNIPVDSLNSIAENLSARTPEMAKAKKLIDKVGYEDEYVAGIKKALKVGKDEEYNTVDILDYVSAAEMDSKASDAKDRIAVIYAQGEIAGGEGDVNIIGEGALRTALQAAVEDEDVKSIVLRVDSPGGSALTSDIIWRDIELAKKKKPIVVSMGNYAASGGYYISCNANRIFAEPTTITGSIGVFGVLPNLTKLSNNLGIHTEEVSTHGNASGYSMFTPLKDNTREIIQQGVEHIYTTFVSRVAKGRNMTPEAVDAIAQGRVWTGNDALKNGLVDEIGGLDDAIKYAAKLGKTTDYSTKNYPEYERTFDKFLSSLTGLPFAQSRESFIKEEVGAENYQMIERIRRVTKLKGTQAMMPFEINIR
ncbi:protease IV [Flavobacterium rivuli WB 3.3-2 = DSM 21788]|uniref:Protease IV n=1 Tax=Flavobacterium rivuli WB 3.3-2 = DSM 21788 TaxID=1121895 RepID=A0A0A2M4X6_9FLAO|nr:signal peptide peptidase SppA [Flavobacterium rivuli]KGO87334.1 protease IV [Flavobacterium rivuli WB 3.3-2 = DSM 21788]